MDESLVEIGDTFSYRHELDRAFVAVYRGRTEITVGRQAIGWGRGVLFGAVDIFAPFTPAVSWIFSDNVTLVANAYLPYGAEPEDGKIRSEYGGTPVSGLLQINFYY